VAATYRGNGQVETLTDGEGNRTTYSFDGHDRLKKTRFPSPTTDGVSSTTDYEELGYDAAGNVTSRRVRDGQVIGYSYDALGRLVQQDLPNTVSYEYDRSYAYDLLGRMTQASHTLETLTFGYDALGRMTSEASTYGTKSFQYDAAGRRTRITHPDGFYVDQDYNVTGEMTHIRENGANSGVGVLAAFTYDDLGRRTSLTRGNGTVTSYTHDAVSRLSELAQNLAGTSSDLTLGFTHNPAGQIATNTRSNDSYSFSALANQSRTDTHNGLNQVTQSGSTSMLHDEKGNIIGIGSQYYTYTADNRMRAAIGQAQFHDDPAGRLRFVVAQPAGTATNFDYDGQALIAEYGNNNSMSRRYVHGPGMDEPLVEYQGSGTSTRRFLHADERGSIVAQSDSSGNVTAVNRYDEYGMPQTGNVGRFGYTGQTWLPEIGMWYYKARMYNPSDNGGTRFMQPDPIGYGDGMNGYAVMAGDPVNRIDPTGLCTRINYVMHVYDGLGNDLGPDEVRPERWTEFEGCDNIGVPGSDPGGNATGGGGGGENLSCTLGNGSIDMTFDGKTIKLQARYRMEGRGASTSTAYVRGIEAIWSRSYDSIASIVSLVPDPSGFIIRVFGGAQTTLGYPYADSDGSSWRINLPNLAEFPGGRQQDRITQGAHEFGHMFFPANKDFSSGNRSIMTNGYTGEVTQQDLEDLVEICRNKAGK
jgi:RHS repeat-associated protein